MARWLRPFLGLLPILLLTFGGCDTAQDQEFVLVRGGEFRNQRSNLYGSGIVVPCFYIGRHEVTQREWEEIMGYNPSQFRGDSLPVEMVTWYESILFCNKKSLHEGLEPYYLIERVVLPGSEDSVAWVVTLNRNANGYRLPTEVEWEYAASGGRRSRSYRYSGSNEVDEVAWYWRNSGDQYLSGAWTWATIERNNGRTRAVGQKKPNELGLFDMSGNVREWCEGWYEDPETESGLLRAQRGGGWIGDSHACAIAFRGKFEPNGRGPDQGLRLSRSADPNRRRGIGQRLESGP